MVDPGGRSIFSQQEHQTINVVFFLTPSRRCWIILLHHSDIFFDFLILHCRVAISQHILYMGIGMQSVYGYQKLNLRTVLEVLTHHLHLNAETWILRVLNCGVTSVTMQSKQWLYFRVTVETVFDYHMRTLVSSIKHDDRLYCHCAVWQ